MSRSHTTTRVLFVIDELTTPSAGTEGQLLQLMSGLMETQAEPQLAVLRASEYLDQTTMPFPVHVLGVDRLASVRGLTGLTRLTQLTRAMRAQVAHIFFNDASIAAPVFCRMGGARVIAARRDMGFWYTPGVLRALRASNRFVDLFVANSDAVRQNVHRHEGVPLSRVTVVANGHDPARFDGPADPSLRARLGIGPDDTIIGMVANLHQRKRQFDLIRALPSIRKAAGPAHLVFVGTGPEADSLRELARSLGLERTVHLLQGCREVVPIVKHFDVAVLCSDSEGFSNAIIEYAFCARPIVCTNVGGNPEFIKHDESGLLVDRGDVDALAGAVSRMLSEPANAARLGAAARKMALERCSKQVMVASHLALYDATAAGTPLPRPA